MCHQKCEGMYVNVHICVHEPGVMCMCAHVRIQVHQCVQVYVYECICMYVYMYMCYYGKKACIFEQVYAPVCVYVCMCVPVFLHI